MTDSKTFGLQPLLDRAKLREDEAAVQLAALAEEERNARTVLNELRAREETQLRSLSQVAERGAIDPAGLDQALAYLDSIEGSITSQLALIDTVVLRAHDGQEHLVEMLKERQVLERLRDRRADVAATEERRKETSQVDDLNTQRHHRRQGEAF